MWFEGLTCEYAEMAQSCESPEELLALARTSGYELCDDELEAFAGGWDPIGYLRKHKGLETKEKE